MLAESLDTDEDRSQDLDFYKKQAKQLLQTLGVTSEPTGIITTGNNYFLYLIENGVCYLTMCDATFPKKLAYSFLEELKKEFDIQHGADVNSAKRPYSFQKFGKYTRIYSNKLICALILMKKVPRFSLCDPSIFRHSQHRSSWRRYKIEFVAKKC